jgi:hypothetical protein
MTNTGVTLLGLYMRRTAIYGRLLQETRPSIGSLNGILDFRLAVILHSILIMSILLQYCKLITTKRNAKLPFRLPFEGRVTLCKHRKIGSSLVVRLLLRSIYVKAATESSYSM